MLKIRLPGGSGPNTEVGDSMRFMFFVQELSFAGTEDLNPG
jgi:hypothetical protein